MPGDDFRPVASTDQLEPGQGMGVDVDGIEIALFYVDGDYHAISNRCAHQQAPLCRVGEPKINGEKCWTSTRGGVDDDELAVSCPWHLWEWDLQSGEHEVSGKRIGSFDTAVEDGTVYVRF